MTLKEYVDKYQEDQHEARTRLMLIGLLGKIASSYSDDAGTWDLDDSQPVSVSMTLKEVRFARRMIR